MMGITRIKIVYGPRGLQSADVSQPTRTIIIIINNSYWVTTVVLSLSLLLFYPYHGGRKYRNNDNDNNIGLEFRASSVNGTRPAGRESAEMRIRQRHFDTCKHVLTIHAASDY